MTATWKVFENTAPDVISHKSLKDGRKWFLSAFDLSFTQEKKQQGGKLSRQWRSAIRLLSLK